MRLAGQYWGWDGIDDASKKKGAEQWLGWARCKLGQKGQMGSHDGAAVSYVLRADSVKLPGQGGQM